MKFNEYLRDAKLPSFWCAGCGYGQVMNSMARALEKVNATLEKTVIVSGIGCWGHVDSYFKTNAFHGTPGRALAFATGIKLSNPELTVIVVMGDGRRRDHRRKSPDSCLPPQHRCHSHCLQQLQLWHDRRSVFLEQRPKIPYHNIPYGHIETWVRQRRARNGFRSALCCKNHK